MKLHVAAHLAVVIPVLVVLGSRAHAQKCVYVPDASTSDGSNVIPFGHQSPGPDHS